MSRRVLLLGVGLALVALALGLTDWALSLQPGVTEANVKRIREGMTIQEAEGILGGLPDFVAFDHKEGLKLERVLGGRLRSRRPGMPLITLLRNNATRRLLGWNGDEGQAIVELRADGRVGFAMMTGPNPFSKGAPKSNPLARLLAWLGL